MTTTGYLIFIASNNVKAYISIPLILLNMLMWGGLFGKDASGRQINYYRNIINNRPEYHSWKI